MIHQLELHSRNPLPAFHLMPAAYYPPTYRHQTLEPIAEARSRGYSTLILYDKSRYAPAAYLYCYQLPRPVSSRPLYLGMLSGYSYLPLLRTGSLRLRTLPFITEVSPFRPAHLKNYKC